MTSLFIEYINLYPCNATRAKLTGTIHHTPYTIHHHMAFPSSIVVGNSLRDCMALLRFVTAKKTPFNNVYVTFTGSSHGCSKYDVYEICKGFRSPNCRCLYPSEIRHKILVPFSLSNLFTQKTYTDYGGFVIPCVAVHRIAILRRFGINEIRQLDRVAYMEPLDPIKDESDTNIRVFSDVFRQLEITQTNDWETKG